VVEAEVLSRGEVADHPSKKKGSFEKLPGVDRPFPTPKTMKYKPLF